MRQVTRNESGRRLLNLFSSCEPQGLRSRPRDSVPEFFSEIVKGNYK